MIDLPEPGVGAEPAELLARYLDFYREAVVAKVRSLPEDEQRRTRLPSGWTPLEMLTHLVHMERRWVVWGFLGEEVDEPWGDDRAGRWHVPDGTTVEQLDRRLEAGGALTRRVLAGFPVDSLARLGGRFESDPPSLMWICFHVLQEYARHAGQLDVAVELAGGPTGE